MMWNEVTAADVGKHARVWADDTWVDDEGDTQHYHVEHVGTVGLCGDGVSCCLLADDGETYTFDEISVELT